MAAKSGNPLSGLRHGACDPGRQRRVRGAAYPPKLEQRPVAEHRRRSGGDSGEAALPCPASILFYLHQSGRRWQRDVRRRHEAVDDFQRVSHVELPEEEGELRLQLRA